MCILERCVDMIIIDSLKDIPQTVYKPIYIKNTNKNLQIYDNSIYITDLENALKAGKQCKVTKIIFNHTNRIMEYLSKFFNDNNITFSDLDSISNFKETDYYSIVTTELPSIQTFSPFVVFKPVKLPDNPKKINLSHVYKMLINKQIKKSVKDMSLTDDYAYDAACNFKKGNILNNLELAKDIIEHKSGYWLNVNEFESGKIGLNCHHFDYNTLYLI